MGQNALYIEFRLKPTREELAEILIKNQAAPAGDVARLLDEMLDDEADGRNDE